jgi:hypothetical protein
VGIIHPFASPGSYAKGSHAVPFPQFFPQDFFAPLHESFPQGFFVHLTQPWFQERRNAKYVGQHETSNAHNCAFDFERKKKGGAKSLEEVFDQSPNQGFERCPGSK